MIPCIRDTARRLCNDVRAMLGPRALPTTPRAFLLAWLQRLITCTLVAFVVVYPAIDAHYRDAHRRHYQVTILEPVPADVQTAHPHE